MYEGKEKRMALIDELLTVAKVTTNIYKKKKKRRFYKKKKIRFD
jgi:hypothetical protein